MCVLFGPHRIFTNVYPFSLDDVEGAVEEVRAAARERGVTRLEWWIGPDAQPPDLAARLRELGLEDDPPTTAMALMKEPPAAGDGVVARPVRSVEELRIAAEVAHQAFKDRPERLQAALGGLDDQWTNREGPESTTFLAYLDGGPVGSARSAYLDEGVVLLVSGAVLETARGRGAYRALVRARWDDAVARGTTVLLVMAGPMSRPILGRVGFEPIVELEIMADHP